VIQNEYLLPNACVIVMQDLSGRLPR